jgi:DNA-directed RNA polymerase specialized sigma24 family protein
VEQQPATEIAQTYGVSAGAARVRVSRALENLRAALRGIDGTMS